MATFRMYVDIWPGMDTVQFELAATTRPPRKRDGVKRVAFDIEIPDEILFDVDAAVVGVSMAKEVMNNKP